jgi:hypothetical protein
MVEPLKLAVKYEPPMIALYYQKNGKKFIHEIPILYDDLECSSEEIYEIVYEVHTKYLANVAPD